MKMQKRIIIVISIIIFVIGIVVLAFGLATGPEFMLVILGVALIIASFIAYKSGTAYIDEGIKKYKEFYSKKNNDERQ